MRRLALFPCAFAAVADEEEAAEGRATDKQDEAEDREGNYESQVFDAAGICGGRCGGVGGREEGLGEDPRWADGEGGSSWGAKVAVEAEGFEDWRMLVGGR